MMQLTCAVRTEIFCNPGQGEPSADLHPFDVFMLIEHRLLWALCASLKYHYRSMLNHYNGHRSLRGKPSTSFDTRVPLNLCSAAQCSNQLENSSGLNCWITEMDFYQLSLLETNIWPANHPFSCPHAETVLGGATHFREGENWQARINTRSRGPSSEGYLVQHL